MQHHASMTLTGLVRWQLAAEATVWIALGVWLHRVHGVSPVAVLGWAVFVACAIRLAIVGLSSALSWLARSPRPADRRLGIAGTAALVAGEWRAMMTDNFWLLPVEPPALRPGAHAQPILLVHGYLSNRGMLQPLVEALRKAGVTGLATFSCHGVFQPIDGFVEELEAEAGRVLRESGAEKLTLVCHSMGGLVARAWMARYGAGRVARLVTIASPHHGTALAALALGRNARQMRPGSDFLRSLAARENLSGPGIPATSIWTLHDNLVAPQETSRLPWAENVALHGVGHVAILAAPALHRAVLAALGRPAAPELPPA